MHKYSYVNRNKKHSHYISDNAIAQLKNKLNNSRKREDTLMVLKTLADSTRLNIYFLLHQVDEIPVTDICHILELNQSTVSHALSDLKKIGLVKSNRCGQLICYSIKEQPKKRSIWLSKTIL